MLKPLTNDPLWDPDYQGCKMTGLPFDQCGCKHHARIEVEDEIAGEGDASDAPPRRASVGQCRTCGDQLIAGETYEGVFCSWICSL